MTTCPKCGSAIDLGAVQNNAVLCPGCGARLRVKQNTGQESESTPLDAVAAAVAQTKQAPEWSQPPQENLPAFPTFSPSPNCNRCIFQKHSAVGIGFRFAAGFWLFGLMTFCALFLLWALLAVTCAGALSMTAPHVR